MRNGIIYLCLFILSFSSVSQESECDYQFTFDLLKPFLPTLQNMSASSGHPFIIISNNYVHYPRYCIGFHYNMNKIRLGVEVGYGNKKITFQQYNGEEYNLIEFRPKIQKLFFPNSKMNHAIGIELFSIFNYNVYSNERYLDKDYNYYYYESARVNREKYGMMGIYDLYSKKSTHLKLNFYTGLGFSMIHFNYSDFQGKVLAIPYEKHGYKRYQYQGWFGSVEFNIGLRVLFQ